MKAFDQISFDHFSPTLARQAAAEAAWLAGAGGGEPAGDITTEERERRIRQAAYFRAQSRGFAPGHELEDWVEAEQEVDRASRPLSRQ